jgi:hypothetical protein
MAYRWLADLTVIVHLAFVVFVVVGGLLVLRRRGWVWIHLPAAIWGASIEWAGWVCPLTPLENWLRLRAGGSGYRGGFVEHYLLPVLYPSELARGTQIVLGGLVVVINVAFYSVVWKRYRRLERS